MPIKCLYFAVVIVFNISFSRKKQVFNWGIYKNKFNVGNIAEKCFVFLSIKLDFKY